MSDVKRVVIFIRSTPYGMATAGEGFRAIIGLAGMGLETHAVLVDDGVLVAKKDQNPEHLGMYKLEDAYSQVPDFGAKLYVHTPSLEERGLLKDDCIRVEFVDDQGLNEIIAESDHVMTFN